MTDRPRLAIPDAGMLATTRTRRDVLKLVAAGGALVLLPAALTACGGDDDGDVTGPPPNTGTPVVIDFARGDVAVLQLAYVLEQLEADFYTRVVNAFDRSNFTAAERLVLQDIRRHEVIHRELFKATLGTTNGFTITPTFGTLNIADRVAVLNTAKTFEDLGVAAYDGAAQYLQAATNLQLAAKIVSVEARHAAVIRDLLNARSADFAPQPFDALTRPAAVGATAQAYLVNTLDLAGAPSTFVPGPTANADMHDTATGTGRMAQGGVVEALQLALLLKQLTAEFYERGVTATGLIATADRTVFTALRAHEATHVTALTALLTARGAVPAAKPTFDYTAAGGFPAFSFSGAPSQYETFKAIAQALEDLSVGALKGQVVQLMDDKPALNTAIAMHAVDARHAAIVRRIRGRAAWITGSSRDDLPAPLQAVYDNEGNVMHGAVDVSMLPLVAASGGIDAATQAFDEPLTRAQTLAIVTPFLAPAR